MASAATYALVSCFSAATVGAGRKVTARASLASSATSAAPPTAGAVTDLVELCMTPSFSSFVSTSWVLHARRCAR